MNNPDDFVTMIASHLGMSAGTLALLVWVINQGAKVLARKIPNDATGFWGFMRQTAVIIGTDPSSVVTTSNGKPVTVQDIATQAATTPPIDAKVDAAKQEPTP